MSITPIAPGSSGMAVMNPVTAAPTKADATSTAAPAASTSTVSSVSGPPAPRAAAPAESGHGPASGGAEASSSAAEEMENTSFSTTVAGTQYSASVDESDGEYVATVSRLSGATANGASLLEAENNLTVRIDELV